MRRLLAAVGVAVLASGCIDLEQSLTLDRSMAGTAAFSLKMNLEPMAYFMAQLERGFSGKEGEPSEAEIAKARSEMLSGKQGAAPEIDFEAEKKEMEASLPPGVRVTSASFEHEGLSFGVSLAFSFESAAGLHQIAFARRSGKGKSAGPTNPLDGPFEDMKLVDTPTTLLISAPVMNPAGDEKLGKSGMAPDMASLKDAEKILGGLRYAMRITAPFDVIEHTAHRREGDTLVWDYDFKKLMKLTPKDRKQGVLVRYRK